MHSSREYLGYQPGFSRAGEILSLDIGSPGNNNPQTSFLISEAA